MQWPSLRYAEWSDTKETLHLSEVLVEILGLFKINARQAKLAVEFNTTLTHQESTWVGYRGHLTRVVLNLLTNVERDEHVRERDRVNGAFLVFQRPLLDRAINLAEVVDAGVLLCRSSGSDEVGDRDGSQ